MTKMIEVPQPWLEKLIVLGKECEVDAYEFIDTSRLTHLKGYISSAQVFIENVNRNQDNE